MSRFAHEPNPEVGLCKAPETAQRTVMKKVYLSAPTCAHSYMCLPFRLTRRPVSFLTPRTISCLPEFDVG